MLVFNKYFYKKKESKLYFGDRVAVLNDFIYQTGGSMYLHFVINVDALNYKLQTNILLPSMKNTIVTFLWGGGSS
jgi:hypothetical protein